MPRRLVSGQLLETCTMVMVMVVVVVVVMMMVVVVVMMMMMMMMMMVMMESFVSIGRRGHLEQREDKRYMIRFHSPLDTDVTPR